MKSIFNLKAKCHHVTPWHNPLHDLLFVFKIPKVASSPHLTGSHPSPEPQLTPLAQPLGPSNDLLSLRSLNTPISFQPPAVARTIYYAVIQKQQKFFKMKGNVLLLASVNSQGEYGVRT